MVKFDSLTDKEIIRWMKSKNTKEKTWYVFNGCVPSSRFLAIDFKVSEHSYVSYDFELHGRSIMESVGLQTISNEKLLELNVCVLNKFRGCPR